MTRDELDDLTDDERALVDRLRALPRESEPPLDLERSIHRAIDAEAKSVRGRLRRWWAPMLGLALAGTAAAIVIVARPADRAPTVELAAPPDAGAPPAPVLVEELGPLPLPLGVEGELTDDELDDDVVAEVAAALDLDDEGPAPEDGLVPDLALEWIDDLDDDELEAVDAWLAQL